MRRPAGGCPQGLGCPGTHVPHAAAAPRTNTHALRSTAATKAGPPACVGIADQSHHRDGRRSPPLAVRAPVRANLATAGTQAAGRAIEKSGAARCSGCRQRASKSSGTGWHPFGAAGQTVTWHAATGCKPVACSRWHAATPAGGSCSQAPDCASSPPTHLFNVLAQPRHAPLEQPPVHLNLLLSHALDLHAGRAVGGLTYEGGQQAWRSRRQPR